MILGSSLSSQPPSGRRQRVNNSFPDFFARSLWGEAAGSGDGAEVPHLVLD